MKDVKVAILVCVVENGDFRTQGQIEQSGGPLLCRRSKETEGICEVPGLRCHFLRFPLYPTAFLLIQFARLTVERNRRATL